MLPIELDESPTKRMNSARGGQHHHYYLGASLAWIGVLMGAFCCQRYIVACLITLLEDLGACCCCHDFPFGFLSSVFCLLF